MLRGVFGPYRRAFWLLPVSRSKAASIARLEELLLHLGRCCQPPFFSIVAPCAQIHYVKRPVLVIQMVEFSARFAADFAGLALYLPPLNLRVYIPSHRGLPLLFRC